MARRNLSGLGFEFAAAVAGFTLLGFWIGNHFGKGSLGILVGAVLGIAGAMYNLVRAAIRSSPSSTGAERAEGKQEGSGEE